MTDISLFKRTLILLMCVGLGISGCSDNAQSSKSQKNGSASKLEVKYVTVKEKKIGLSMALPGRVRPYRISEIRPQVDGIILDRLFEEGSFVKEGQQLYQIDPARYQAQLDMSLGQLSKAKANLSAARSLKNRYQKLVSKKAVSEQELADASAKYNEIKANVAIAQAEVKNARINLQYTKVLAPISGFIGKSAVTKGALVSALQEKSLTVIRTLDPVYVDISQPVSRVLEWRKQIGDYIGSDGKKKSLDVTVKVENSEEIHPQKGKLEVTELSVNEQSGSVDLRAVVPNPDRALLPGMFIRAYVQDLSQSKKLLIPQSAVTRVEGGEARVWIINDQKKIEYRRVQTGAMIGSRWVIEKGLKKGERVAMNNFYKLKPGIKVSPLALKEEKVKKKDKKTPDKESSKEQKKTAQCLRILTEKVS